MVLIMLMLEKFFTSLGLNGLAELGKAAPFVNNHYS